VIEFANCVVVIPCFNEGSTIAPLVDAVQCHQIAVIVVDDGSGDDTAESALKAGAIVVRHERNRGKGAALKTGLSLARDRGFDWAITMDGDGQHSPDDLPPLVESARSTQASLVVGNRMPHAEAIPWLRRQVNRWMSRKISQRAGRHLPDTQCGFRLVNLGAWAALPMEAEHFEVESEMLLAFVAAKHRVEFVPIRVIGRTRRSHIHPLADAGRWWKWWRRSGATPAPTPKIKPAGFGSPAGVNEI
jgi:glycosyltransferase involved in cell wall biosynthesis